MIDVPEPARCRDCGYALRGLSDGRCPECGRSFDPADATTMDLGRRPGRIGRWLLRPTGWRLVLLAVVGAGAVLGATRWPVGGVTLLATDLLYYFDGGRFNRSRLMTHTDVAYVGGLLLIGLVLLMWLLRAAARPLAHRLYRRPPPATDLGRRTALAAVTACAVLLAGGGVFIGWPYRLARLWAARVLAAARATAYGGPAAAPLSLTDEQEITVLRTGLARLPTRPERVACLRALYDRHAAAALAVVLDQLSRERDPVMLATLVHLVGLHREYATLDRLLSMWDDPDPDVRAAAIDAVGMLHAQAYPIPNSSAWWGPVAMTTDPPVELVRLQLDTGRDENGRPLALSSQPNGFPRDVDARLDPVRPRFVDRMLRGATDAERQAAARGLLQWQPSGYRLRVAEWGVWIADHSGRLTLVQSVLDEIPQFVHRTDDTLASLAGRVNQIMMITKPVLHVTVDRPMVLDVQVLIAEGRPWFAYPKPDDFELTTRITSRAWKPPQAYPASPIQTFDRPGQPPLEAPHEGYPWIDPPHRKFGSWSAGMSVSPANQITALGLRWQSVIVSPERLGWMVPPAVPADPRFAWWERLRQVDCAWVSNCGEAERFLYYDGPTTAAAPVAVSLKGNRLRFRRSAPKPGLPGSENWRGPDRPFTPLITPGRSDRRGLLIRVIDGRVRGLAVPEVDAADVLDLAGRASIDGEPATAAVLHGMLTAAGLSESEAAGLIDCWRPQLFRTPGSRFLLLMTAGDYDALCPIRIDPPPTELVRVGLVLTEFSDAPISRQP
jgi:hypothetical protein